MAFVEIEDEGPGDGNFHKFEAIGDRLDGYFLKDAPSTAPFAKSGDSDYFFLTKEGVESVLPQVSLKRQLKTAKAGGQLKPGSKVQIVYASDLDTGKETPMKVFKLLVDPDVKPETLAKLKSAAAKMSAGAAAPSAKPASKPPPKPPAKPSSDDSLFDDDSPAAGDDDIPF